MSDAKINIIGFAHATPPSFDFDTEMGADYKVDVKPYLKERKGFKFLSKQDSLAMVAAYNAWEMANIKDSFDPDRTGIYLCTSILPFEDLHLNKLTSKAHVDGVFDMERFSTESFHSLNPLLTFKCLPNMSLFHISHNLGITGNYFMTYPGVPEWFNALNEAIFQLKAGVIDQAIVGAVADQRNFLVQNHIKRTIPNFSGKEVDLSSVLILTTDQSKKSYGTISEVQSNYHPYDPMKEREALLNPGNYFKCFTGSVEASLYITLSLEKGLKENLNYRYYDDTSGSEYTLRLELP